MPESIDAETRDLLHFWFGFQPDNDDQAKAMIRFAGVFEQYCILRILMIPSRKLNYCLN